MNHQNNICFYGCGREGKYFLSTVKKWCCELSHNKCPENKRKNREKHLNKPRPEHVKKILKEYGLYNAKNMSEETKNKLRIKGTGRKHNLTTRLKMSKNMKGIKRSLEFRQKMSNLYKGKLVLDKNPNWRGGLSFEPYCINWVKELKEFIKKRDNYKCQNIYCNQTNYKLVIHHINYKKKDCFEDNLITLCNSCNCYANKDREWWESFYKEIMRRKGI
jgi:hypothetical protein